MISDYPAVDEVALLTAVAGALLVALTHGFAEVGHMREVAVQRPLAVPTRDQGVARGLGGVDSAVSYVDIAVEVVCLVLADDQLLNLAEARGLKEDVLVEAFKVLCKGMEVLVVAGGHIHVVDHDGVRVDGAVVTLGALVTVSACAYLVVEMAVKLVLDPDSCCPYG